MEEKLAEKLRAKGFPSGRAEGLFSFPHGTTGRFFVVTWIDPDGRSARIGRWCSRWSGRRKLPPERSCTISRTIHTQVKAPRQSHRSQ
jgi:hypothetical protein